MKGKITGKHGEERYYIKDVGTPWVEVTKEQFLEAFPSHKIEAGSSVMGTPAACWPLHSEALAVHTKQIAEATENAAKKGIPTEFDGNGRPIFRDRAHRKRYLKAYNFHDNDGGYSD